MNRLTIRNLVIEATRRSDKTSLINSAIDIAVEEVSSQRMWSDLLTAGQTSLILGQGFIDLASDLARLTEIRLIDGTSSRNLIIKTREWVGDYFPSPESFSTGRPVYGYLLGKTLHIVPRPDAAYVLKYTYVKLHPALASDTSEVLIRHAGPVVAAYATFWVFQSINQQMEAEKWLVTYFKLLESAKKIDRDNTAVEHAADIRGELPLSGRDYWTDPFEEEMP